jgi:hypothetical protein
MNSSFLRAIAAPSLFAFVAALSTAPASAQLVDKKSYAGSTCVAVNPANQAFIAIQGGSVVNTSETAQLSVNCPIVMDNTGSTARGISAASVTVLNPNPSTGVSCTLQSRDNFGKVQGFRNTSSDSFKGAKTPGTLQFVSLLAAANIDAIGGAGVYTLSCKIPPVAIVDGSKLSSGIVKYQISEHVKDQAQTNDVDLEP